ncbi:MAG: hypothetical protein CMJ18_00105 [Phycisphaeraceae bacterium]|nr:hypothetical protein [Phycisphaeraceae bacterium]
MPGKSVLEWPTGLSVYEPERCFNGYTLFSVWPSSSPGNGSLTYLIDMKGEVAHVWQSGGEGKSLGDGRLLAANDAVIREFNWENEVVWEYRMDERVEQHHDFARLPNGNTMILQRKKTEHEVPLPQISDRPVRDDYITEVTPDGDTVWAWHTNDHYDDFGFPPEIQQYIRDWYADKQRGALGADWLHTNTLEVLPDGNVLLSFRNLNMIVIVDKATGKFAWKWGTDELVGQHHPNMLDNGNIVVYDNGSDGGVDAGYPPVYRSYTRLVEVNPKTEQIEWEYVYLPDNWIRTHYTHHYTAQLMCRFFSRAWGSVQRLPNGNTLSLDSVGSRLFEITHDGDIVWEYVSPYGPRGIGDWMINNVYRCYRIPFEDVPQAAKRKRAIQEDWRSGQFPGWAALPTDLKDRR